MLWIFEMYLGETGDSVGTILNYIFARENGNKVFNIVQSYYKRFKMYFHDRMC